MDIEEMLGDVHTVFVGRHAARPPYSHTIGGLPTWLVTYTTAGSAHLEHGGRTLEIGEGDLLAVRPTADQGLCTATGERWDHYWAHVSPPPAWPALRHLPETGSDVVRVHLADGASRARARRAFLTILADARVKAVPRRAVPWPGEAWIALTRDPLDEEFLLNGLEQLMLVAARATMSESAYGDKRVDAALRLLSQNPGARHTLASVAHAVHMSPSRLSHLFKAEVGQAPMQFLSAIRIRHASELLLRTDLPVRDVALMAGFGSGPHFSRRFCEVVGSSPSRYRSRQRRALRHEDQERDEAPGSIA